MRVVDRSFLGYRARVKVVLFSILLIVLGAGGNAHAATQTSQFTDMDEEGQRRSLALSLEIFGRSYPYSLNLDYEVFESFAAGVGAGALTAGNTQILNFPIYVTQYFFGTHHRFFVSGGVTLVAGTGGTINFLDTNYSNNGLFAPVGGGYEFRGEKLLFRVAVYDKIQETLQSIILGAGLGVVF